MLLKSCLASHQLVKWWAETQRLVLCNPKEIQCVFIMIFILEKKIKAPYCVCHNAIFWDIEHASQVWQATVNDIENAYILYFYPVEFHVKVKSIY